MGLGLAFALVFAQCVVFKSMAKFLNPLYNFLGALVAPPVGTSTGILNLTAMTKMMLITTSKQL